MYYQIRWGAGKHFIFCPPPPLFNPLFHSHSTFLDKLVWKCLLRVCRLNFFLDPWLYNLLLDKAGLPQAQAAVGASASATDPDVNKLATIKLGSGLSTGGR